MKYRLIFLSIFFLLSFIFSASAALRRGTEHNIIEFQAFENGDNIYIEAYFIPQQGWHLYSHTPGSIGLPTNAEWTLYEHRLLNEDWSLGEDINYEGFNLNVYRQPAIYKAKISSANGKKPSVKFSWMACKEECIPESLVFELTPEIFSQSSIYNNNLSEEDTRLDTSWIRVLFFAFIGGIILNFMPCVFPILFLKIISVLKQCDNNKDVKDSFAYLSGILVCFSVIAIVLYILRRSGEEIGWGFQLQSPLFVGIMALLFLVLALVFLGIISIRTNIRYLPTSSFMTGFLAVLIASPCTAPFMGAALGWALMTDRPAYFYYPVFISLGLGYGLPFFLAGIYPQALKKILPVPGRWMLIFQRLLAIPMIITFSWLIWVLVGTRGETSSWQFYKPEEVQSDVLSGKKVLINFTAKWCISCLVNEKRIFSDKEFMRLVRENNISLYKADWTKQDKEISEALNRYGRGSVPLYIYYDGSMNYHILPQLPDIDDFRKIITGK